MELLAAGRDRYTQLLVLIAMATALVGVLIEFQFYLAAGTSGNSGRQNADFFANFYLFLSASALLVHRLSAPSAETRSSWLPAP